MVEILSLAFIALWVAIGSVWFVSWWTEEVDLTIYHVPFMMVASLAGPFVGCIIRKASNPNPLVIVKRKS